MCVVVGGADTVGEGTGRHGVKGVESLGCSGMRCYVLVTGKHVVGSVPSHMSCVVG